jgi:hypothetical protein
MGIGSSKVPVGLKGVARHASVALRFTRSARVGGCQLGKGFYFPRFDDGCGELHALAVGVGPIQR